MARKIIVIALVVFFCVGSALAEDDPIIVGSSLPLTGPWATSGETMIKAIEMAVEEYNAKGGLLGRQIKIVTGDTGGMMAEEVTAVAERLAASDVDVILTGYGSLTNANIKVYGKYDFPYLTGPAYSVISDAIEEGMPETNNCFEYCWDELTYGRGLLSEMFEVPKKIGWTPPNKKIATLKNDVSYNILPAELFAEGAKRMGYELVVDEITQIGKVDFGTVLTKLEREKPSFIFVSLITPEDAARFTIQFHERFGKKGLEAIVVHQYACSTPEFLELTGPEPAEGVINMYGAIRYHDPRVAEYIDRWVAKYKEKPFDTYAVHVRDAFEIWVQAVKRAGCVDCYDKVTRLIRESTYDGMFGTYVFSPRDQTALFGEYLLPLEWIQFQDGAPAMVSPERTKATDYRKPPWIK